MNLDQPGPWRLIWIIMAMIFGMSELVSPAAFFFLPFAIGAVAAAVLSFMSLPVGVTWTTFMAVSLVSFAGLWKIGRRLEQLDEEQEGVGATRWVGQEAVVTKGIGDGGGQIRSERESWRAESLSGEPIDEGSRVLIARLAGTRLVVVPVAGPDGTG